LGLCDLRPDGAQVPKISEFFGIAIYMYFADHPPPHFHARYAEFEALIRIDDFRVLRGSLPPRVFGLVVEWATMHQDELRDAWQRARDGEPLRGIAPLE
jgi:hypothetical protein